MPNPTLPFPHTPDYSAAAWLPTKGTSQAFHVLTTPKLYNGQTIILVGPAATGKTHLLNIWKNADPASLTPVDNLQNLDSSAQEKLFHTYNAAKQSGQTLLLASQTPPAALEGFLPDLVSRLTTAIVLELTPPTDAERKQLLLKWLSERQLNLAPPVQDYLLTHGSRNVGELHSLLAHLDDISLGQGRPITIPLIRPLLQPDLPL